MLKRGSIVLSIWCGINFILAFIILCYVIVFKAELPNFAGGFFFRS